MINIDDVNSVDKGQRKPQMTVLWLLSGIDRSDTGSAGEEEYTAQKHFSKEG